MEVMPAFKKTLNTEIGGFLVADRIMMQTRSSKIPGFLHKVPVGKYNVHIKVVPTTGWFHKSNTKSGKMEVVSGQVFIGDPGAVYGPVGWDKFLDETKYLKKLGGRGVYIDVGGDGKGVVEVTFTKVK
jgi:hypothetical protein